MCDSDVNNKPTKKVSWLDAFLKIPFCDLCVRLITIILISMVSIWLAQGTELRAFSETQVRTVGSVALIVFGATTSIALLFCMLRAVSQNKDELLAKDTWWRRFWLLHVATLLRKLATDLTFWNFNAFVTLSVVATFSGNYDPIWFTGSGALASAGINIFVRMEKSTTSGLPKWAIYSLYILALFALYALINFSIDGFLK